MAKAEEFNLLEFQKKFGTEEACEKYLFERRWAEGFLCHWNPPVLQKYFSITI